MKTENLNTAPEAKAEMPEPPESSEQEITTEDTAPQSKEVVPDTKEADGSDVETPSSNETVTEKQEAETGQEVSRQRPTRKIVLISSAALALVICCMALGMLLLREPVLLKEQQHSPKSGSIVMETSPPPTIPPTEPTEPPTEAIDYEMQIDLDTVADYHAVNEDVTGWLYIDDTVINYPVVKGDDNSFYINHNWQKQSSSSGSIFQDYECSIRFSQNTLIYGHNLANGTMLHAIKNYKVEEWGLAHPYVEVSTLDTRYLYKVISVNVLYGDVGASFDYWNYKYMDKETFDSFVQQIYDTSLVWYGDEELPVYGDHILTLQTCNSGARDGMRCVVFAVRILDD